MARPRNAKNMEVFVASAVTGLDSQSIARKAEANLERLLRGQADLTPWPPFVSPAPAKKDPAQEKRACFIQELLPLENEEFLLQAYLRVLGRNPDPGGMDHFLAGLRDGRTTKVQVVARLRLSPEGKAAGVAVPGLYGHLALDVLRQVGRRLGLGGRKSTSAPSRNTDTTDTSDK